MLTQPVANLITIAHYLAAILMKLTTLSLPAMTFLTTAIHAEEPQTGLANLFNGKDLMGWTQKNGTATYRVEDGAIVGKTNEGSPYSFLCSDKLYGDFEFHFEVKVDPQLNSGVQIRSQTVGDTPEGRVNGPQVEISLDKMAGYVYGESAGGADDARCGSQTTRSLHRW